MKIKKLLAVVLVTALFPWLFYENYIGINLLIFNVLVFAGLLLTGKLELKKALNLILSLGTLLTAFFVVFNGSDLAIAINIISLFLIAGSSLFPEGRNIIYTSLLSLINLFTSQLDFFKLLKDLVPEMSGTRKVIRFLKLIVIPIAIVFLFVIIYKFANPVFEGLVKSFFDSLDRFFTWFFENIEFAFIMSFVLGFILANYLFLGKASKLITGLEENSSDKLIRRSGKVSEGFKMNSLKTEYRSAIILFALLNILILVINIIDIRWVWFNFEWDGEYLKQFVHEGTYLLILSIIISLAISIYYFRGNINFLKNNAILRKLAYLWLAQNAILTISVGIRNFWYIHYFNLAYLRIGVIFFLILTLYSIYSVIIKINSRKTTYFLFRKNSVTAYVLLVIMAFFNWDTIIAKYNFSHSETAFVHFDFLAGLSNNALPYLDKTQDKLTDIDIWQPGIFPFREQYMNSREYYNTIQIRKDDFIVNWPERKWQEWNYAGERAYRKLVDAEK